MEMSTEMLPLLCATVICTEALAERFAYALERTRAARAVRGGAASLQSTRSDLIAARGELSAMSVDDLNTMISNI
ncbi:hypothetical protein BCF44_13143 [Kutzneria buriramensis]|uniref:Uncharacterized protein n=1 Tax=Kutzneria buriramensis TaxID=1045776 RepID=A0A3E0GUZ5_9PSEU|nr:hypothetical protein BCF44_13143 [Kutzneria buriramensis]